MIIIGKEINVQLDITHIPRDRRKLDAAEERAEKEAVDKFNFSNVMYPTDIPILPKAGDDFLLFRRPGTETFVIDRTVSSRRFFYEPGKVTIVLDLE